MIFSFSRSQTTARVRHTTWKAWSIWKQEWEWPRHRDHGDQARRRYLASLAPMSITAARSLNRTRLEPARARVFIVGEFQVSKQKKRKSDS